MNTEIQRDDYQKAQVADGSVHMLWSADGKPVEMLCGRSKATATTFDLLRARVTCKVCRERALAIVEGSDDPRS